MASYEEHAQAAIDALTPVRGFIRGRGPTDVNLQIAQVEAILALAAAVAGRHEGSASARPPLPPFGPHNG